MGCGNPTGSGCAHYNPTVDDNPYVCKRCHICPECWDTRTTSCCHKHHRQLARIMIRYILRYMELEELKEMIEQTIVVNPNVLYYELNADYFYYHYDNVYQCLSDYHPIIIIDALAWAIQDAEKCNIHKTDIWKLE